MPGEVASGIIGVHDDDGPGARGDAAAQRLEVEVPAMIVEKLVGNQPHIIQLGQKVEQRIARLANQHLVAGIAEQPEEKAVGLAGAGGEKDLFRIDCGSMVAVIEADRLARARAGPLDLARNAGLPDLEGSQERGGIVSKAAAGRIGSGQIPELRTVRAQPSELRAQGVSAKSHWVRADHGNRCGSFTIPSLAAACV